MDYSEILTPFAAINENDWLTDRSKLWNKVESSEIRYDAQLSREMIIAIPRELDRDAMINLVCDHVQASYVDRGMIADINLHHLHSDNPHAHVMLTMRELIIDSTGTINFGKKNRSWNDKKLVETQKKEWEVLANEYLDRAGVDARIDARSYEEQGVDKIPQIHIGAAASRLEKRGIKTQRGDHNREVAIANQAIANTQADINQANQTLAEFAREAKTLPTLPDQEQRLKDRDIFAAVRANPDLRNTKEYQDARDRKNSRFYKIEKPKEVAPEPERIKKWDLSSKKKIDPQLIRSIMATADRLGTTDYQAGNYHVQLLPRDEIKVSYQNNSVMIIYADACNALPLDRSYTVDQYGQGLMRSIEILITDLDRPAQLDQSEEEKIPQGDPAPELSQGIIIDDAPINREQSVIEIAKLDPKSPSPKTRRLDRGRDLF